MSGKWVGFTEEDIRKLSIRGTKDSQNTAAVSLLIPKQQSNTIRQQVKKKVSREKNSQSEAQSKVLNDGKTLTSYKMLTNGAQSAQSCLQRNDTTAEVVTEKNESCNSDTQSVDVQLEPASESPNQVSVCLRIKEGRRYEVMGSEKMSLEDFQARQKLMEEQNRRRKEFLSKALSDRKKQTHAEAQRLQQIQEELQKLDMLLSNDVSILRNQIEVASLEFSEAQKRYNKAEKEFLDAKMKMFGKLEQKELLTEHLCTIIEQNEMRKARKLSELMEKLELGVTIDTYEETQISSSVPSLNTSPVDESRLLTDLSESSVKGIGNASSTSPKMEIEVNKTPDHLNEMVNLPGTEADLPSGVPIVK